MPQSTPEAQLEELWRAHAPAVLRYARRRVLPGDVDEVVAETFLVAWRRLSEVPDFPLPWLLGVARGVSANVRRTARRRDALTDRVAGLPDPVVPPVEQASEVSAPLQVALDGLGATDRELLTLLAWDGLSREEAARALGVSRGAVAVRLHRLRRRLKTQLDGWEDDSPCSPSPHASPPLPSPAATSRR